MKQGPRSLRSSKLPAESMGVDQTDQLGTSVLCSDVSNVPFSW